ncbi:hypothetical protein [Pseudoalteromonas obscura]|uniref:Uncharacterized protein n=1 Tax=Pseudoalteromonas obscura TaxID=3048491 RepID=A0ABT7EK10_9GAMM|nr:hypothetical protein [Pseudoalteromonas sp. P94(2023)]MDK2595396.1 hypothetical protein [Pseudoalteromonas sp. P94(2023)]
MAKFSSILSKSKPAIFILFLGIAFYFGIIFAGESVVSNMETLKSHNHITEVITNKLLRKYDKLALGALIAFLFIAVKRFWKDIRRL